MKKNLYLVPILLFAALAGCGDKDKPKPNTPDPVALFNAPAEIEKGSAYTFVNSSTDAESFAWTVTPATGVNIAHAEARDAVITFDFEGDYEVKLEAKKTGRPSSVLKKIVKVTANPVADFNFTFEDIDIAPAKAILNAAGSSANASSYKWTIQGETFTFGTPDAVFPLATAGNHVIKLVVVKDGKSSAPIEKTNTVHPGPSFTIVKDPNLSPSRVTVTNTSVAANFDSFQWSFEDASTTFQSPLSRLFYEPSGTFSVSLIAKKNGVTRTSTIQSVDLKDDFLSMFYAFSSATNLVKDSSGNNKHAFIPAGSNPVLVADKFGKQHAIYFDGTDDRFTIPQGGLQEVFSTQNQISISLRIKLGDAPQWSRVLLGSYADAVGGAFTPILYYSSIDSTIWGQWPGTMDPIKSAKIEGVNNWYHVVLTADRSNIQKLYINGVLQGQKTNSVNFGDQRNTDIGRGNISGWPGSRTTPAESILFFRGVMDDIRVYQKALSLEEVQTLNNQ
jgi:hypothetical protein